ncbi:hypothetical protein [Jiangella muralis]|uniref:hypothetical protein n=1 Tax=Jiangella muralis TaxID=702383 RepID=UPI0012F97BD3|nr:hypothetical protein [Jiangella muralis]
MLCDVRAAGGVGICDAVLPESLDPGCHCQLGVGLDSNILNDQQPSGLELPPVRDELGLPAGADRDLMLKEPVARVSCFPDSRPQRATQRESQRTRNESPRQAERADALMMAGVGRFAGGGCSDLNYPYLDPYIPALDIGKAGLLFHVEGS